MVDAELQQKLFLGIAFAKIEEIKQAHSMGADLNKNFEDGETPLTEAILGGMGNSRVVKTLLVLGADPNKRDGNGWSPWAACISRINDNVVHDRMLKIKQLLCKYGADKSDETILSFEQCVINDNISEVRKMLMKDIVDVNSPLINPLACAVEQNNMEMAALLLRYNADPDGNDSPTCVMLAAEKGYLDIVKLLVEHHADLSKYAWQDETMDAEHFARNNGHEHVVKYLQCEKEKQGVESAGTVATDNLKYSDLFKNHTNGINYGLQTHHIVSKLEEWDRQYGIEIDAVDSSGLNVSFASLPNNIRVLADDIYEFCPDVIDQGFGCMDDLIEMAEEFDQEIDPATMALIRDIDFSDENFGILILERSLLQSKSVSLWWD